MRILNLKFHSDPAHGWLQVPRVFFDESGAEASPFSYYDRMKDMCYLEEDSDAPKFKKCAEKLGWKLNITEMHTNDSHWIRDLGDFII